MFPESVGNIILRPGIGSDDFPYYLFSNSERLDVLLNYVLLLKVHINEFLILVLDRILWLFHVQPWKYSVS